MAQSVDDLKDERRRAFEDVSVALEAISVKSLMEFRARIEVPRPVESVAVASVCMVARVDDTVQVGVDGLPPRTWASAQASMAKPAHFVNSLRQFPYAVDSGRMPDVNVLAAKRCLEDVSPEHLANEPVALRLHDWIYAAWRYSEVVQMLRLQTSQTQPYSAAPPPAQQQYGSVGGGSLGGGTPPASPVQPNANEVSETPGKVMRSSLGNSSVEGSNSVFGRSPIADPSPGADSVRSSRPSGGRGGGQALGGGRGRRSNAASSGYSGRRNQDTTSSTFRVTPSASPSSPAARTPPSQRASPSQPSNASFRRQPKVSVGYPRGPRSNVGIEDWQQKLDQMHREAREMKAMEGQLKWQMKREEEKQSKREGVQDRADVMNWRQDQAKDTKEYAEGREMQKKNTHLEQSRIFQEFKRDAKQREFKRNAQLIKDEYAEKKENSEYAMELKRTLPVEEKKLIIDANLEKYALMSMYNIEEDQREKLEQKIAREDAEECDLSFKMLEARKERDAALQSLEFFRSQQRLDMPSNCDIPTRPFYPNNQPL